MSRLTRFTNILLMLLLLLHRLNTVSCRREVVAFIGDAVLLPCSYSGLPKTASVYWTDKDDRIVLEIIANQMKPSSQNQKFKGRVSSFQNPYETGNFSIVMMDVEPSDSSPYDCLVPSKDFQQRVFLTVSGKRVEVAATRPPGPSAGAVVTPNPAYMVLLSLLLWLLFICFPHV